MKRLFAAAFFTSLLHLLPAQAQPGKPGAPPAAKPPAAAPDGRAPGQARPGQVAVSNRYTGHLSADPAQFILDVGTMMLATNNNAAKLTGDKLRQLWGSNTLTSSQQLRIAELSQKLLDKKFRPQPHLVAFYAAIVGGKNQVKLGDAQLDQLLEVLGESLERDPTGDTEKFLVTTARVLNGGYLYRSGFNSLRVAGGQFSFAHKGKATEPVPGASFDSPAPADPTPAALPAAKPAAAKPVAKAKPKPVVKKKRASDGWDTGDMWSSGSSSKKSDGWGSDDGWGTPAPKKKAAANDGWGTPIANDGWGAPAPKKKAPVKTVTKAPAKPAAAKPAAAAPATKPANDGFDQPDVPFAPSVAAALAAYYPPAVSGPVIDIKDADMVVGTAGDSIVLHKVSGTTAVLSNRFLATGGKMDWTVKNNPVSADLGPFDLDLSKPEFTAQPVTLTYPYLLEAPIKGALSYKAVRRKPANGDTGYPRFISLTNDARLKNMGEGITYQGGLSMAGARLLSAALDGSLATITVQQEGKRRFRATSRNYVLGDSLITTPRAAVALYEAAHDSITHPGVELKYLKTKQSLKLLQEDGTFRRTPYSDSYHQVDVRAEMVVWNLREPKIDFSIYTSPKQVSADFESKNFFSNVRYQQLKSINHLHPLQMLMGYSQDHGKVLTMSVRDVAAAVQIPEANLRSAVVGLARDGYVEVQPQTGEVTILPKGKHYVGAAREKKDFDHIAIKSLTGSGRSATLNLNSEQLLVRGVEQFSFSDDSAAVVVRPDSGVVRLERNRNLKFSGRVIASAYRFKGKDFQFDYDGYYIDMPHIDSLTIRSKAPKKTAGKAGTRPTDFTLTNKGNTQSGRLFLNDPKNRSGRKKLGKYPAFNSTSGATVFFNKPDVLGGAYDSTTYFDVPPFKFDSMGTGKSRANVVGTFHSKALPPIKTTMTTQEDGSLGFTHVVPATGYALYGGKGKLSGGAKVRLNSQGLQSDGTVTYLGATMQSDRFVMYGDSLTGEGKAGAIAAGPNFPKVTMPPGFLINWNAKSDSLHLLTTEKTAPVKMYADHTFKGGMLLTPKGLGGDGRLDGPQSYVRSESLTFKNDSYSGKKAVLSVKSAQAGKPALTANDTNFNYDLKNGVAEFKRDEGSTASLDLPYAGFRTGLSEGRWDFKKKRVTLKTAAASTGGAYVASTRPEQKGLKFKATSAAYDITKSLLETKGVPYIAAADAWIVPDSGRVSVAGGGKIQTLRRATVLLDSLEKFHKLTGGNITVTSRDAFSGDAKYMSRTATGDSVAMKFTNFKSDSSALVSQTSKKRFRLLRRSTPDAATPISLATTATASVDNNQKFQLAPSIGYRGGISLNSQKRGLIFDGEVQLQFGKQKGASAWFAVQDSIDPKNVVLTLTKPKTEDGTEVVTGLYLSDADNKLYPRYAAPKATDADLPVLPVDGKVRYDAKTGEYTISKVDAADPKQYEGAVLTYNETNGRVNFRGPMNFIVSNKNYSITAAGVGTANPDSARYQVDALLGFDINITSKAMDVMAANLGQVTKNGQLALDGSSNELYKIGQLAGNKATEAYASRAPNSAPPLLSTVSSKLVHTLTLSRADLRWSPKQKAWHSVGKIGLAGINKRGLNALVDGYIEIKRENSTDQVEVYLEADPQTWYYIRYANNIVVAMSSSESFNNQVGGKAKGDANTATEFGVFLGDYSDVDGFRSHFERDYLGKSGKLAARPAAPEPAPDVDTDKKSKKKKKDNDPFSDGEITPSPSADPTTEAADTGKKSKKKKKDNDPFGDGEITPAPAAEPTKKEKAKEKEAAPAADPATAPTEEPSKKDKKKAKEKEPAADPAATPDAPAEDTSKKSKKEKKKEAEAAPDPAADPSAEPTTDPGKKSKKKKKGEEDPFGDS
jgi:hypothetical protein